MSKLLSPRDVVENGGPDTVGGGSGELLSTAVEQRLARPVCVQKDNHGNCASTLGAH